MRKRTALLLAVMCLAALLVTACKQQTLEEAANALPSLNASFTGGTVKVTSGDNTYEVHRSFKDALNQYDAFGNRVVEEMNKGVPAKELRAFELALLKAGEKLAIINPLELTADEIKYHADVSVNILKKLKTIGK